MLHLKEIHSSSLTIIERKEFDSIFVMAFRSLSESILAQLIMLNRRRQGEVRKITVDTFRDKANKISIYPDAQESLSPVEKSLCQNFTRLEIAGKRQRLVPVLVTESQKTALHLFTDAKLRYQAGISENNIYIFAATGRSSLNYIWGHDVLRKYATECNAENPMNLRSTIFRKHIATLSQIPNLRDHELYEQANFMGHDIRVHREFYRLPSDVLQTAKVAKILLAMERGEMSNFKGKSLDDIDITPDDNEFCLSN